MVGKRIFKAYACDLYWPSQPSRKRSEPKGATARSYREGRSGPTHHHTEALGPPARAAAPEPQHFLYPPPPSINIVIKLYRCIRHTYSRQLTISDITRTIFCIHSHQATLRTNPFLIWNNHSPFFAFIPWQPSRPLPTRASLGRRSLCRG